MLEYIIGSGIACIITGRIANVVTKSRMDKLGYVAVGEAKDKKKTPKDYVLGFLSNFIPIINNIAGLILIGTSLYMGLADDEKICNLFDKMPNVKKASEAKEIYDRRIKTNSFSSMEDSMKIDGADQETIKKEMKQARVASGVCSDKTMKKINAMSDAELWLLDIELNTGLTEEEKKSLYTDYVKEFSKEKAEPKAVEKTIRMMEKINR